MLLAAGLLVLAAVLVYLGRYGYRDTAHPGRPLSALASVYYATVTLSTTGYGDIVPVTDTARLVNTVLITPLRVVFLIVLVGTTLEVLTERTRMNWRITRWRAKVAGQVIVVGYGSKGRAVIRTLSESGVRKQAIVVIDATAEAAAEANAAGLAAVTGDGTRSEVPRQAEIGSARQIIVAVNRDDTAVLIALTARQLNPSATIAACGPGGREPGPAAPERRRPRRGVLGCRRADARRLHHPAGRGEGDRRSAGSWPQPRSV